MTRKQKSDFLEIINSSERERVYVVEDIITDTLPRKSSALIIYFEDGHCFLGKYERKSHQFYTAHFDKSRISYLEAKEEEIAGFILL